MLIDRETRDSSKTFWQMSFDQSLKNKFDNSPAFSVVSYETTGIVDIQRDFGLKLCLKLP